jgi:8-oxo-dGTP pyrophosphatase MutT (NUDIX family)
LKPTEAARYKEVMRKSPGTDRWALAAYVVVRDARGRVLMLRRGPGVKHFAGCWELPGGKPAEGENFAKTAELEVDEETGLYVPPTGIAGAVEGSVPGLRVAMLIMEGRATDTNVTLSDEHDDYRWVPLNKVSSLNLRPGFDVFFRSYSKQPARAKAKRG